jgi:predicted nuclease of predicted toxin-antitoxin system
VRFLVDRCAGHRLAEWLRTQGHDVVEVSGLGPDPGDRVILDMATRQDRILITIDTDFGRLVHGGAGHAGLLRLPDVPAAQRIELLADVLRRHGMDLDSGAVITVKGGRIRISGPPRG